MSSLDSRPGSGGSRAGIHRIPVPTPFPVGDVNTYLIDERANGGPLALVDTGPNLATSLAVLEHGLALHGVRPEQLELIILTHQHTDHVGLVATLQQRSGAAVAAWEGLDGWLGSYPESAVADDQYARDLMSLHGLPEDLNAALAVSAHLSRALGSGAELTLPLADGATLEVGARSFRVLHRPGHSPSDIVLWDEAQALALGGDHLMASVATNAILARPPRSTGTVVERPRPLLIYRESLRRTRELPEGTVLLPGHGPDVGGHRELISERLRVHSRRGRKVLRTLAAGPLSAHQITLEMWGRMAVTQAPLMMSEVLGYLDMLLEDGLVRESERDGVVVFEAV